MARIQRALAQCHDSVVRRTSVIQALNPRRGEQILEVGCGGGFYTYEVAQSVGTSGRVCAIDISDDQLNVARERCADIGWVELLKDNVLELSYADAQFDAVYSVQVIEYVPSVDDALRQIARVLKPGGRFVIYDTNWSSVVWFSRDRQRMKRMLDVWNEHCPHTDLPAMLPARLRAAGLRPLHQQPVPVLNMSYHQNSYSYWAAQFISKYVVGQGAIDQAEADAWSGEFDALEDEGAYFFCSTPVLTEAIKVS